MNIYILVSIIHDNCIKQLVSMNASLWLKFKYNKFAEKQKKCEWIMNSNIDAQNVIFEVEKLFTYKSHPKQQNSGFWSVTNLLAYEDCIKQGAERVMAWTGKILPIYWLEEGESSTLRKCVGVLE